MFPHRLPHRCALQSHPTTDNQVVLVLRATTPVTINARPAANNGDIPKPPDDKSPSPTSDETKSFCEVPLAPNNPTVVELPPAIVVVVGSDPMMGVEVGGGGAVVEVVDVVVEDDVVVVEELDDDVEDVGTTVELLT